MEITIQDKTYKLKYTVRALFIFEQITQKPFQMKMLTDEYIFLYSLLLANNKDMELTFDNLLDAIDEDSTIMKNYNDFIYKTMQREKMFANDEDVEDKKKV